MGGEEHHGIVIGAGVSGLVAALELEKAGWRVTVAESRDQVGGRVTTHHGEGFPMDEGFQVLLSAYPHVKNYIQTDALELIAFRPGARCMNPNGDFHDVGDPRRDSGFWGTLLGTQVATWGDKLRLFRLMNELRKTPIEELFRQPETSTATYLNELGFSEGFQERFLRPFLAGIFLDSALETSNRMCRFVLKMFGEGDAVIPRGGMAAIPQQLRDQLKNTTWRLGCKVKTVTRGNVQLEDGEVLQGDLVIVATGEGDIIPTQKRAVQWRSVDVLYLETSHGGFGKPILGLMRARHGDTGWVNNFHFLHDVFPGAGKKVISATVTRAHDLPAHELADLVTQELEACGIPISGCVYQKTIRRALPICSPSRHTPAATRDEMRETGVFLAGDHLTNPSLQGAMESGRVAVEMGLDWFNQEAPGSS